MVRSSLPDTGSSRSGPPPSGPSRPGTVRLRADTGYRELQPALDELGTPLAQTTFVVVDLETTGGRASDQITEIGAVKVTGGQVEGEFATFVNPGEHIPAMIQVLTGITDQMVIDAPSLGSVLPSFLEFSRGCVLVAHNAGFDIGFLKQACARFDTPWPGNAVVDTVALSRQVLLRGEVANHKLSTLAAHFGATTTPNHRALSDARATVDVLHGLLARVGNLGVQTLEDLQEFTHRVSPERRARRVWAKSLPESPGVYWFHRHRTAPPNPASAQTAQPALIDEPVDDQVEVLYVGTSVNLRRRVASYFTSSETRPRMDEMVRVAEGVRHVVCQTPLEAAICELRMIQAHGPRYNRRSRHQHRVFWLRLTDEAFPRLSVVRTRGPAERTIGPFTNRQQAVEVQQALSSAHRLRTCTMRLSPRTPSRSCALAELGQCLAPCLLDERTSQYLAAVDQLVGATTDVTGPVERLCVRLRHLADQHRFEDAAAATEPILTFLRTARRWHRLSSINDCPQIVAAAPDADGWQVHVIRHGRLAAAARCSERSQVPQCAATAEQTAATVRTPAPGTMAATIEETERIADWLEGEGVRLLWIEGEWAWPRQGWLDPQQLVRLAGVELPLEPAVSACEAALAARVGP